MRRLHCHVRLAARGSDFEVLSHMAFPLQSVAQRDAALLAPYAMHSADSAGRRHAEPPHEYRGPYQRDRDRIVHSAAYRRLSHKTQVFTSDDSGDYHRTRLTHTLEVASIARTIGRSLRLNEDLIEALALLHDIGHPPFGHSGEATLNECLAEHGGFSHNAHALRIAELLEQRYVEHPGLNLTVEVLEGQRTRIDKSAAGPSPLLEVQVVDAADSIAYDSHDADDALELGLISLEELGEITLWDEAVRQARSRYGQQIDPLRLRKAVVHELIDSQVIDLQQQISAALGGDVGQVCNLPNHEDSRQVENLPHDALQDPPGRIQTLDDVRRAPRIAMPSATMSKRKQQLESFLHARVYRHPDLLQMRQHAQGVLGRLFACYTHQPSLLPQSFRDRIEPEGLERSAGDYLAGMTDRFVRRASEQHLD